MAEPRGTDTETVSPIDLRRLVLAVVLEPGLALARVSGLELDDVHSLVSVGYFREYQRRGLSLRGMRKRVGKSLRTLARLSKQAAETGPPMDESLRVGRQRRVVRAIAGGARDLETVAAQLPDTSRDDLEEVVETLVDLAILEREGEELRIASHHLSLVREDLDHRLESLRHFLTGVAHVVYSRFYRPNPEAEAFARVFTFSVSRDRLPAIRERIYEVLREEVFTADADAEGDDEAVQASALLAFVETPTDLAWRKSG